jgi:hypothetical protein
LFDYNEAGKNWYPTNDFVWFTDIKLNL